MGKKGTKKTVILENVPIHGIADRGKGVGRTAEGMAVFVEGAVPGDVVDVRVQKKKGGFAEGTVHRLVSASADRVQAFCRHFSECGGCKWQNLSYEAQLHHKHQVVEDAISRIGKVPVEEFLPILGAPQTTFYRNKMEFGFSNRRWLTEEEKDLEKTDTGYALGFHRAGFFDKIIDIQECWLQADPSNALRNALRDIALEQKLAFYDLRRHEGYVRNLMVRLTTTGERMVVVSVAEDEPEKLRRLCDALLAKFPEQITTLVYNVNTKFNDALHDLDMKTYIGKGYVVERLGDLQFKIGPKSFFQTNSVQGKNLYDVVVRFAGLTGAEVVYDLYTGTGSIALYLARFCRHVVGIEEIPDAVADAQENMQLNGIANARFYVGDVKEVLSPAFAAEHGNPDVVVTDPPRAGMHEKAVSFLLELAAPKIVYVSCNPATQARDLQLLSAKYDVKICQPVDMFPHTHHIENVALLALRK